MVKVIWKVDKSNKTTIHLVKENQQLDLTDKETEDLLNQLYSMRPDLNPQVLDEIKQLKSKLSSLETELEIARTKLYNLDIM